MATREYRFDDPLRFKTLIGIKWRGSHFYVLGEGFFEDDGISLMVLTHLFPRETPYTDSQCIEYHCSRESLREVHGEDHRYLCTVLLDLDLPGLASLA